MLLLGTPSGYFIRALLLGYKKLLNKNVDRCGKILPLPGFDPRTVQPVASRYTD